MKSAKKLSRILALGIALALALGNFSWIPQARAALSGSSVALSDARTSQSSTYTIEFDSVTTSAIKCIKVVFSTAATGGTMPTGMTTTSAAFDAASDYVPTPASWAASYPTNGTVHLKYDTGEAPAAAGDRTVVLTGITNGSTAETGYYVQFSTYNNMNCSSNGVDSGTGTFIYTSGQAVSLTVDPTIEFGIAAVSSTETVNGATTTVTTTDGTINLGTVTTSTNGIGAHDLTTTTNAGTGYTASIRYTATPSDGVNDINDHSGTNGSPTTMSVNTEAFGYTTNDATLSATGDGVDRFTSSGGNKWAKFTTSNAEVAYNAAAVSSQTIRVGYQAGITGTTAAATYLTTVIITCTPQY